MAKGKEEQYIRAVYARGGTGTLEERKAEWPEVVETPALREKIAHFLSYEVYDNEFMLLIAKEELLRESIDIIRTPITVADEEKKLKLMELKSRADNACDKLVGDIKKLRSALYGEFEREGGDVILKALSPEERLKKKKEGV